MAEEEKVSSPAEAMMQMAELGTTIIESVAGYRAVAQASGFSETISEVMAKDYHKFLLTTISNGLDSGSKV